MLFGFLQNQDSKEDLQNFLIENKEELADIPEDFLLVIDELSNTNQLFSTHCPIFFKEQWVEIYIIREKQYSFIKFSQLRQDDSSHSCDGSIFDVGNIFKGISVICNIYFYAYHTELMIGFWYFYRL